VKKPLTKEIFHIFPGKGFYKGSIIGNQLFGELPFVLQ
jgi:hypothetical protein